MYDAIVIGGGIVGASVAYHLVQSGAKTLLVDRADAGRATDAGAGIIAPEVGGISIGDAWFEFALEAVGYYPALIEQLQAAQGGDTGYARCGLLMVAASEDEVESYEYTKYLICERQRRWGVPLSGDLQEISSKEARELFLPLADVQRALYFSKAARVDGKLLTMAMLRAATQRGLEVRLTGVEQLMLDKRGVAGVVAGGEAVATGRAIIAGGAWSQAFGEQLGVEIPVTPQRGQIVHLGLPGMDTGAWPIVEAFHGHYLVCWPDSRVVAGATREIGAGFSPRLTAAGVREVLSEALRVAPGLAGAEIREMRVGLRPYTADHLPVLGTVPGVEGVYLATGMGATGLHLGPYSGKLAAEWALGRLNATDISAFGVARFSKVTNNQQPLNLPLHPPFYQHHGRRKHQLR